MNKNGMNIFELMLFMVFFGVAFTIGHYVALKNGLFAGIFSGTLAFLIIGMIIAKAGKHFDGKREDRNESKDKENIGEDRTDRST